MSDPTKLRRVAALRACDRILSGVRPATMRERLADLDASGLTWTTSPTTTATGR